MMRICYWEGGRVRIRGSPVDRAIRAMESQYGGGAQIAPACRGSVNCATAFPSNGESRLGMGADDGFYVSLNMLTPAHSSLIITTRVETIQINRVTQIAMLEAVFSVVSRPSKFSDLRE